MKNPVIINTTKEEIIIKISDKAEHKEIIESLNEKIPELKKLYKKDKTPIHVTGKNLKNKEIEEVKKIIESQIKVQIMFDSPEVLGLYGIKKAFEKEIRISDTKFYKGSIRSGQKIEYEGSIVILGDVNGGAEIVAGENIVVLGILRGLAHAGAKGNKKAIIASNGIDCPQIRIANIVKEIEKEQSGKKYKIATANEKDEIILK